MTLDEHKAWFAAKVREWQRGAAALYMASVDEKAPDRRARVQQILALEYARCIEGLQWLNDTEFMRQWCYSSCQHLSEFQCGDCHASFCSECQVSLTPDDHRPIKTLGYVCKACKCDPKYWADGQRRGLKDGAGSGT